MAQSLLEIANALPHTNASASYPAEGCLPRVLVTPARHDGGSATNSSVFRECLKSTPLRESTTLSRALCPVPNAPEAIIATFTHQKLVDYGTHRLSNVFWDASVVHESPTAAIYSKFWESMAVRAVVRPKTAISNSADRCAVAPVAGRGRSFHGDLLLGDDPLEHTQDRRMVIPLRIAAQVLDHIGLTGSRQAQSAVFKRVVGTDGLNNSSAERNIFGQPVTGRRMLLFRFRLVEHERKRSEQNGSE
jgi:hypothetical protein